MALPWSLVPGDATTGGERASKGVPGLDRNSTNHRTISARYIYLAEVLGDELWGGKIQLNQGRGLARLVRILTVQSMGQYDNNVIEYY